MSEELELLEGATYHDRDIEQELKWSYLQYSMSVIVGRALPDVRDGMKPIHRRILFAMDSLGLTGDKPYRKSATVVGEVIGKYHPHGESSVYDAMVRMAQDFTYRNMLVDGHGNFGSVDGDPPAAQRYTEVRMAKLSSYMLADIDKDTVDMVPNFDESLKEPSVLPARFPQLLVNGSSGIAVGMATNIPPHNLGEVIDGTVALIDNPELTPEQLNGYILGPDFPTGAQILGVQGIRDMYATGRGSIKVRAKSHFETMSGGKVRIVVDELPYMVNKAELVRKIAELHKDKKIVGVTDLRDESDRSGMRVVVELKKDANPNVVLNQLYKHTPLESNFGAIMLTLVNNVPKVLNLSEILTEYIKHQKEVVTRRSRFDLNKAEERAHILEGLLIAMDHIDEVIALIRASKDDDEARNGLMERFALSEKQAQAILDMRLKRLTGLERGKVEEEYRQVNETISRLRAILADEKLLMGIIKGELLEIKEKFADPRRTELLPDEGEIIDEDLIPQEEIIVSLSNFGYVKRMPVSTYKAQRRGGKGVSGGNLKEEDAVEVVMCTNTHSTILFFTNKGKVYNLKGYNIPEASRQARGTAIVNLIQLEGSEKVTAALAVNEFSESIKLFFVTQKGTVKKTSLDQFSNIRKVGLIALNIKEDDELIAVRQVCEGDEIIMVSRNGMSIRFKEGDVRSMGRTAAGVRGMRLKGDDIVVGADIAKDDHEVLVFTENGYGKRTEFKQYRCQARGGSGVKAMNLTKKTGKIASVKFVSEKDDLLIMTGSGQTIRMGIADISVMGRSTQGVRLINLKEDEKVIAAALMPNEDEEEQKADGACPTDGTLFGE
ncbi:MAG TPA: DNA gyrase subunit A [Bacillota bacterium]|mgnify:CR=1 FL=1|nr:DNA gyrase subunit A [Bacillota bacterium]HOA15351.1 DNA gyrase subunit A [Bacillota bacterium]